MLGGYEWARIEHFTLTILFTLFFVVHIVQVLLAGWNNFRSMVTGFEVVGDATPPVIAEEQFVDQALITPQNI